MAKAKTFIKEVQGELKKAAWPKREELRDSAVLVVITSVLLGLYVGLADFVFSILMKVLIR